MLKVMEKAELCQVSLTGIRALVLLELLIKAPHSLDEIRDKFIELNIIDSTHSNDILRIDLNTLRTMGCEITRASAKTNYKYVLIKHPYSINITLEEIALLKKAYKKIKDTVSIDVLLEYDKLFKKLANYQVNEDSKQALYGISVIKNYDINLLKLLDSACDKGNELTFLYKKPDCIEPSQKKVIAQKIVYQNDKIYLYAHDIEKNESSIFNIKRIKKIISNIFFGNIDSKTIKVRFLIKNFGVNDLDENEQIISDNQDGWIIEGDYHNEFVAMQRMLSFGANCIVIEPKEFRDKIIQKLKEMRMHYNG